MGKEKKRPLPFAARIKDLRGIDCRKATRRLEWLCEWISYWLSRWAFLEVLEYLGKLSLLVALIMWIYPGCRERREAAESAKQAAADARKSRHYVAWQTINSAVGKPGSAGRADALHDLSQDGITMDGISLAGNVVLVGPLDLTNARMRRADFSDGYFEKINFSDSEFEMSKWDNAHAFDCDFRGASLWGVTFRNSSFVWCDFGYAAQGQYQRPSDFLVNFEGDHSEFRLCNLAGAEIPMGIWKNVSFNWCNFAHAAIWNAFIGTNVSLLACNLFDVKTQSPDFIKWVCHQNVAFTNIVSLEKWNYCVTNGMVHYSVGGPEFMEWASNQFTIYIKTNNPQAWLDWSRDNLKK